ncbi:MAG: PadR family transcriptional regulator [archaeon]|nr:PadR family transcriptional regulator [archaeon]
MYIANIMDPSYSEWRVIKKARGKYVKGLLDLLILTILKEREMSGYDLIGYVYRTFEVLLSPGTLYPMLDNLEDMGLIEGIDQGRKKLYKLTNKGEVLCRSLSLEYMKITSRAAFLQTHEQPKIY